MYLLSSSCLGVVSWASWLIWNRPLPEVEKKTIVVQASLVKNNAPNKDEVALVDELEIDGVHWARQYRRPLYDPPPVIVPVVKKKPRPIKFRVTGTILEPDNPQAIISTRTGEVRILRVGSSISDDPLDGKISAISSTRIVVQRPDDEVTVSVESQ